VTPAPATPDPQRAIDRANADIRAYLRDRRGRALASPEERAEYHRLVDVYMAAVAERDGRLRVAEDEAESVAA
jgi:hypothetical protein